MKSKLEMCFLSKIYNALEISPITFGLVISDHQNIIFQTAAISMRDTKSLENRGDIRIIDADRNTAIRFQLNIE